MLKLDIESLTELIKYKYQKVETFKLLIIYNMNTK